MSGYLRFSRTGFKPFDDVIEMLEAAGDAYHHTGQWADDGWDGQQFAHFPEHVRERLISSARWWSQYPENVRRAWK